MPFWDNMLGRVDGLMGSPQLPQGGVMGEPQVNPQQDARLALASTLLSGTHSGQGFNTILGKALMAGQAARQQAQTFQQQAREQQSQQELRQAQTQNLLHPQEPDQLRTARALQTDPSLLKTYEDMRRHGMDPTDPAAVRIYLFRQGLTDEQRSDFDAHQFAPPQVSFQNTPGMGSVLVDPANRLGGGQVTHFTTPEQERAALAANKGAEATSAATGAVVGGARGDIQKKAIGAQNVLGIIDIAEPLINVATGSTAGAATDAVAGFFGQSLKGAQATAQLRALEASLILAQPRMEGPQSNADAKRYEQAAGQIGDPKIPRKTKLASLSVIRQLNEKYQQAGGVTQPTSTPKRVKVDAQGNIVGN